MFPSKLTLALLALAALVTPAPASQVTLRHMIEDARYWPPPCTADPCVLTGLGGIPYTWTVFVDRQAALGRSFVVRGICASACEIAARRAGAVDMPGAHRIVHKPGKWVVE